MEGPAMTSDESAPNQTFVELDQNDFERLQAIKNRHGVTWRGMFIAGAIRLTRNSPLADPPDLPPDIPLKPCDSDGAQSGPLGNRDDTGEPAS